MQRISGIDPGLALLLERAPGEIIDYGFVMDCLKGYKHERVKLHNLLRSGALIRVKKGIYIFGPKVARKPYAPETVANMLFGPSYVSLEWACQYYRLIPERVTTVTSVTTKRSKEFQDQKNFIPQSAYIHTIINRSKFFPLAALLSDIQKPRRH